MHIHMPLGYQYSATLTGAVLKLVRCESCQVEYVYQIVRTGTGSGASPLFLDNRRGSRTRRRESGRGSSCPAGTGSRCGSLPRLRVVPE
jgi:hypothetical protein